MAPNHRADAEASIGSASESLLGAPETVRETRRLERERQAWLRYAIDQTALRTARLSEAGSLLRTTASPFRRALGALLGSRGWDAATRCLKRLWPGTEVEPGGVDSHQLPGELERVRRARDRAARRLGAYEGGASQLRRALGQRLGHQLAHVEGQASGADAVVVHEAPVNQAGRSTIAFRVAAPDVEAAMRGGDYHLAESLASALRRRGHAVLVETAAHGGGERGATDVRVVLRGREAAPPRPGVVNILWIISHPDQVTEEELVGYDHVLVASEGHAGSLVSPAGVPVSVLPQFASSRFTEAADTRRERHDLLFVGNWRGVYRRIVWDAHCLGRRPALVGDGWRYLAPAETVARHVPYPELPGLYRSARILLVDHWDDMRDRGYVSNRVFDALASGVFVIADDVQGLTQMLPGALETYRTLPELDELLRRYLADPDRRASVAARGRELVLASHTVEHRADELLRVVEGTIQASPRQLRGAASRSS